MVYSPSWLSGLDMSLDWYRIHIKSAITADTLTNQLNDCYVRAIVSRCSSSIFKRAATGGVIYDFTSNINQGYTDTEGWDLGVNYRLPEFAFGRFAVHWNTTYTSHLNLKQTDDAKFETPLASFGGFPASARTRRSTGRSAISARRGRPAISRARRNRARTTRRVVRSATFRTTPRRAQGRD
jgi:iron complex outermembrane receptor protein